MKRSIFISLITLLFVTATPAFSQSFLERMAKHAKKKAEQEAGKQAEKKIDKSIEKTFENIEKKYNKKEVKEDKQKQSSYSSQEPANHNQAINSMMKNLGVSSTPVNFEDRYKFTSSVVMNFKTYDKNGKLESDGDMVSFYNTEKKYIAYEFKNVKDPTNDQTGIFILDFNNKATLILGTGDNEHSGIAYGMGNMLSDEDFDKEFKKEPLSKKTDNTSYRPNIKRTGKTKTIAGYKCDEYVYEDDDFHSRYWITKDVNWDNKDLMSKMFKSSVYSYSTPNGFLMESETKDKTTGDKMIFRVTEVKKDISVIFDMSQYDITNIGNVSTPSEKDGQ